MRIRVRDVCLFVDVEGASLVADGASMRERPALLLIHGGPGGDHSVFKPSFSTLSAYMQVIYVDVRGCGRSDRGPPGRWTLKDWADDIAALCEVLGLKKPFILGLSFGGYVAMKTAIEHPDLAAGLILLSTTARLRIDRALHVFERLGGEGARAAAARFWAAPTPATFDAYARFCLPLYNRTPAPPEAMTRPILNTEVMFQFFSPGAEGRTFNLLSDLVSIAVPTLILAGEDDPIATLDDALDMQRAFESGRVTLLRYPGCGHGVVRDEPDRALEEMRSFVLKTFGDVVVEDAAGD